MISEYIISSSDKNEYLEIVNIEKQEIEYFYQALIVEDHFSDELKDVINEYWECVDQFSIILADDSHRWKDCRGRPPGRPDTSVES